MITAEQVIQAVNETTSGTDVFLVDVKITPTNEITVFLDNDTRITLNDCAKINRLLEEKLNREAEDFDLTVSSPGIDQPFKQLRQYQKRIGSEVAVTLRDGQKVIGKLTEATESGIIVQEKKKEKIEGKKGRQIIINNINLTFEQIKETKLVLSF